jgi:hypothetical protein
MALDAALAWKLASSGSKRVELMAPSSGNRLNTPDEVAPKGDENSFLDTTEPDFSSGNEEAVEFLPFELVDCAPKSMPTEILSTPEFSWCDAEL